MNIISETESNLLTPAILGEIDKWTEKFPPERRQSAILPALLLVQESHGGWLTTEIIEAVADYLTMARVTAFEVATFYSMLETQPVGKYKISICTNISCLLAGCDTAVAHLKLRLGIEFGETTLDRKFTLREAECLGACTTAPVMHLGNRYYENLTPEKIDQILEALK